MAKRNTPSHKRISTPPAMRLTERDQLILQSIYECRILTSHQLEVLHFSSNDSKRSLRSACQRRLQKLYHHGYIDRIHRPMILGEGRNPFAYALDKQGVAVIANRLGIDRASVGWKPKNNRLGPMFLEHLLQINTVRVVALLLNTNGAIQELKWIDELSLKSNEYQNKMPTYQHSGRSTRIYPDGFFSIRIPSHDQPAAFFLEIDQGTMQNSLWANKVKAYLAFRNTGQSYQYFGTKNFRVLAVVNSEPRLKNLKRTTEKANGISFFWFVTQDQMNIWQAGNFMNPIWHIAGHDGLHTLF